MMRNEGEVKALQKTWPMRVKTGRIRSNMLPPHQEQDCRADARNDLSATTVL